MRILGKWVWVLPSVIILALIIIFPIIYSFFISLHSIDMAKNVWNFIGIEHYRSMLSEARFYNSLRVTGTIGAIGLTIQFVWGLGLALVFYWGIRGTKYLIVIFLIPCMISPIATAEIMKLIFSADYGPVNYLTGILFNMKPIVWLSDPRISIFTIIIADTWQWMPFVMLLLYTGLIGIPHAVIESARIDGANSSQILLYILFPLLKPIIMITLMMRGIEIIKLFELPLRMTQGGPGISTETLSLYIYQVGFRFWRLPSASVITFITLGIVTVVFTIYLRAIFRYEL